jgi:hypothetical protein
MSNPRSSGRAGRAVAIAIVRGRGLPRRLAPALVVLALAGCGSSSPGATTSGGGPQSTTVGATAAQPTAGSVATAPASQPGGAAGGTTVSVTLTGGATPGTYTSNADPLCSKGLIGPDGWGVQFSLAEPEPNGLSSVQVLAPAADKADDENSMFAGIAFKITVTVGSLLDGNVYDITVVTPSSGSTSEGTGSATVEDAGTTAAIQAGGTTADGVGIDATINCPSVTRT